MPYRSSQETFARTSLSDWENIIAQLTERSVSHWTITRTHIFLSPRDLANKVAKFVSEDDSFNVNFQRCNFYFC